MQAVEIQGLSRVARLGHRSGSKLSRPGWVLLPPKLGHGSIR